MGGCSCGGRFLFVTASLLLTAASILVGISFFGPFWLSHLQYGKDASEFYIEKYPGYYERPNRGLWAQCGKECTWFWQNKNELQDKKFTKLRWHLATQIMYFIAATLMLVSEIFARVQMCCHGEDSTCVFVTIGTIVLLSLGLQTASLATFGGGADSYYNVESNPIKITRMIQNDITGNISANDAVVYLGWVYWVAVTGAILTLLSALCFFLAGCCSRGKCCVCEDACEDCCDSCCRCRLRCCCGCD